MSIQLIARRLEKIRKAGLFRVLRPVDRTTPQVTVCGKPSLLFCSNNYLGLAEHPVLAHAAAEAAVRHGVSSGASRLVSGSQPLHEQLELQVAQWKGTESALLFNSGYAANTGIIAALAGRGDVIFSDRLNHASIIDGAILSGAKFLRYPHNDLDALELMITRHVTDGLRLIVTDGVFSMDGDLAPLKELAGLAEKYDSLLMLDDAHAGGVIGRQGRGSADFFGVADRITVQMGTFGKALGSFGAFAACSSLIRDYLINRSRSLIFSTSLPPAVLAASSAAVSLAVTEEGELLRLKLAQNGQMLRRLLQDGGMNVPEGITPIIPLLVGDTETTVRFSANLLDEGVFVQGIRPPTVPPGTSRLRCTVMASHSEEQIQQAAEAIIRVGNKLGVC